MLLFVQNIVPELFRSTMKYIMIRKSPKVFLHFPAFLNKDVNKFIPKKVNRFSLL